MLKYYLLKKRAWIMQLFQICCDFPFIQVRSVSGESHFQVCLSPCTPCPQWLNQFLPSPVQPLFLPPLVIATEIRFRVATKGIHFPYGSNACLDLCGPCRHTTICQNKISLAMNMWTLGQSTRRGGRSSESMTSTTWLRWHPRRGPSHPDEQLTTDTVTWGTLPVPPSKRNLRISVRFHCLKEVTHSVIFFTWSNEYLFVHRRQIHFHFLYM